MLERLTSRAATPTVSKSTPTKKIVFGITLTQALVSCLIIGALAAFIAVGKDNDDDCDDIGCLKQNVRENDLTQSLKSTEYRHPPIIRC